MKAAQSSHKIESRDITCGNVTTRKAIGYIRVSTDMQAADGLSLDAQTAAIEQYCAMQGLKLVQIHKDVLSGGKVERPKLQEALRALQRGVDVLVVLKFDRLSRSGTSASYTRRTSVQERRNWSRFANRSGSTHR